jgi:hypothetical protein
MLKTVGNPSTRSGDQTIVNGNLVIGTAGRGINFSADPHSAGMTSELLDDYEEGTWTPTLSDNSGNNATMNASASGSYTKVGRLVTCWCRVVTTSIGSMSGDIRINGLPFTVANVLNNQAGGVVGLASNLALAVAGQNVVVSPSANTTRAVPNVWDATTGTTVMQASEWGATGNIYACFSYYTA